MLEEAYRHTPTCYDLHVLKAKVLRHKGALKEAAAAIRTRPTSPARSSRPSVVLVIASAVSGSSTT